MVIPAGEDRFASAIALPWESVDPGETQSPTDWNLIDTGDWFLEAPPGDWKMDGPAPGSQDSDSSPAGSDPFAPMPVEDEEPLSPGPNPGGWTIAILCIGLGLIAATVIFPQADANRRLAYQREKVRLDLAQIQKQVSVNQEFLNRIEHDPQLIERVASREMRAVLAGETVLDWHSDAGQPRTDAAGASIDAERMSPFMMINVPPPPALKPYQPLPGTLAGLCLKPGSQLCVLGAGMLLAAAGLVLGDRDPEKSNL